MGLFDSFRRDVIERSVPDVHGVTLYFPGCYTQARAKHAVAATRDALRDLGVAHIMLDIACCGCAAWLAGYEEEFQAVLKRNKALLEERKVARVITNDPECAITLKERYGIETLHLLQVLDERIDLIPRHEESQAAYLHSGLLRRLGVERRVAIRVLRRAGVHVSPERTADGALPLDFARNEPEVASAIMRERALRLKLPVVACCPHCATMMAQQGAKARDLSETMEER